VLLVGDTGTSKTATVSNFLQNLDKDTHILLNINFSSRTSSLDVQRNLEANVEKRTKEVYGPPSGKRLILFLDDMNMPQARFYTSLSVSLSSLRHGNSSDVRAYGPLSVTGLIGLVTLTFDLLTFK